MNNTLSHEMADYACNLKTKSIKKTRKFKLVASLAYNQNGGKFGIFMPFNAHFFLLFLFFVIPVLTSGQDIHFSHIHASPTHFNPAMMGMFNGEIRLIANYKSQWQTFDTGFRTFAGSIDGKITPLGRSNILAGGFQVYADKAGDLGFSTNNLAGSMSIIQALDHRQRNLIAFGVQTAYISQRFNMHNIKAFDDEISRDITMLQDRTGMMDLSMGVGWFNQYSRSNSFHLGAAFYHINQPVATFYKDDILGGQKLLYRKLILHGGGDFKINRYSSIKPGFIFMQQGPHTEITMGAFWKYRPDDGLVNKAKKHIYFGLWGRFFPQGTFLGSDALIAAIRYDYGDFIMTLTFDFNTSKLGRISSGSGGPELSVIQTFAPKRTRKRKYKVKCPDL